MTKGRRLTIAQVEAPPSVEAPQNLRGLLQCYAGLGISKDPRDALWLGGKVQIDVDKYLCGDLDRDSALDQILLAIIDAYPSGRIDLNVGDRMHRLGQARKYLIGARPESGPVAKNRESELEKIAWEYFCSAGGYEVGSTTEPSQRKYLRQIVLRVVLPDHEQLGLTKEDEDNRIRGHIEDFEKHKDRLLVKVSAHGLPQLDERRRQIAKVIEILAQLAVIPRKYSAGDE